MLDQKDKIIFEYLMKDCRISTSKLAKITKLSQPSIVYRIKKLEDEGWILKYDTILNHNKFKSYKKNYLFRVNGDCSKFENELNSNVNITSLFRLIGIWNYYSINYFKTKKEIIEFEKFLKKNSIEFQVMDLKHVSFLHFSLFDLKIDYKPIKICDKELKLDKTDLELIKLLCDGCARESILNLSQKLKLNYEQVLYRFKRLVNAGYFSWFIAQPGVKRFTIQNDVAIFEVDNLSYEDIIKKLNPISKIPYLMKLDSNRYLVQILTQNFEEYKQTIAQLSDILFEYLVKFDIYNTKDSLILNRYSIDYLI